MDAVDDNMELFELFFSEYINRQQEIKSRAGQFAYYTSAETAMQILLKKEVWLRNATSMNDFSEIKHGYDCLLDAFLNSDNGKALQKFLERQHPKIVEELTGYINGWRSFLEENTYLLCISEHDDQEDDFGRLSMWRAYGGKTSIAIILKNGPFLRETNAFEAYAFPVEYGDRKNIETRIHNLLKRLESNISIFETLSKEAVIRWLFGIFKIICVCTKHKSFAEEREWRVVYQPDIARSDYVKSEIVSLNGVPQQVYKIPLQDIPEKEFTGATIPEFVDRIIIGPTNEGAVLSDAFCKLLKEAECEDAEQRVCLSGIPLRSDN